MIVYLLSSDIEKCRELAVRRVDERIGAGKIKKSERDFHDKCHFVGTLGELAVCKQFSCRWSGEYFEGASWKSRAWDTEVGEVRATFHPDLERGMRFYKSDDRVKAPYILVALRKLGSQRVQAKLVGWSYLNNRRDEWFDESKGYWVVPVEFLEPMHTLPTVPII